jgi:hypothetical protein
MIVASERVRSDEPGNGASTQGGSGSRGDAGSRVETKKTTLAKGEPPTVAAGDEADQTASG